VSFSTFDSATLSNDSVTTNIGIAANTLSFAAGSVIYNSGTASPTAFGNWLIYADDMNFQGGAVIYVPTTASETLTLAEGRLPFGKITTNPTTSSTGGGNSGGTTVGGTVSGAAGRGIIQN
jgi:hypothetical protein